MSQMRCHGLRGLQGVLRLGSMQENQQRDDLIEKFSEKIIPALLFNMQDFDNDNSDVISGNSNDDESPRGLADQVIRDLLSRVTISQIGFVVKPLLHHLDNHKLWSDETSVVWTKLFMNSVRESYSQIIVKQVLGNSSSQEIIL